MKSSERLEQLKNLEVKIRDSKVPRNKIEKMAIVARFDDGIEYVGEKDEIGANSQFYRSTRRIIRQEKIIVPLRHHYHNNHEWVDIEAHYMVQESGIQKYWIPSRYYLKYKLKMAPEFDKFTSQEIEKPTFTPKCISCCYNANLNNVGELFSAIKQFGGVSFLYNRQIIGNPHYKRLLKS
ncbi:hypothetical protein ACFL5S_01115, partial [Fibrobacterota bacterium]